MSQLGLALLVPQLAVRDRQIAFRQQVGVAVRLDLPLLEQFPVGRLDAGEIEPPLELGRRTRPTHEPIDEVTFGG
jgi:hypothetical protein